MSRRTWFHILLGTYTGCWVLFLSFGIIGENERVLRIADIFDKF